MTSPIHPSVGGEASVGGDHGVDPGTRVAADTPVASGARRADEGSVFPGFGAEAEDAGNVVAVLADRRRRLGLSQTEVAARMGTSQSAVARLEAGRSDARLSTLERYAAALDTRVTFGLRVDDAARPGER